MRFRLVRILVWLLCKLGANWLAVPPGVEALIPDARDLCKTLETFQESGEWRRHQAYARLLKKHPMVKKQDVSLAIELAVRGL